MIPGQSLFARLVLVAVVFAMSLFARTARAADTFRLQWSLPSVTPVCPSAEKLAREVAAKLGRDPFDDTSPSEIRGNIEQRDTKWVVRIGEYKDGNPVYADESPPFDAPDCTDPHDLAVLQIAVFIQTGRLGLSPSIEPAPKTAPNPVTTPPEPAKSLPAPVVPAVKPTSPAKPDSESITSAKPVSRVAVVPSPRFDSHIFLGTGTSIGLLPAPSPAVSFNAGFGRGRWEFDARFLMLVAAEHDVEPISLGMTAGFVGGCFRFVNQPRIAFLGCGHLIVSAVHSFATKITEKEAGTARDIPWVGLSISPRLRVVLAKPLTLQIGTDLVIPVIRTNIYADKDKPTERILFTQTPIAVIPLAEIGLTIF